MKKNSIIFAITAIVLLSIPVLAWAEVPAGLVPTGCQAGCPCTFCDLYDLADNIIGFLLYMVAVPIAAGSFLYGGVLMLTSGGNPGQITKGRGVMTNAVIGMALAFFAWAIFNTILSTLGFGINNAKWYDIPKCQGGGAETCNIVLPPKVVLPPQPPPPVGGAPIPGVTMGLSHADAATYLRGASIGISSTGECEEYRKGCTYLGGLSNETIQKIISVDAGCGGCVTITGGTEPGHRTHGVDKPGGDSIVDMRYSDNTVKSLSGNGIKIDANFGKGFTCEDSNSNAINCRGSVTPHHIHVKF